MPRRNPPEPRPRMRSLVAELAPFCERGGSSGSLGSARTSQCVYLFAIVGDELVPSRLWHKCTRVQSPALYCAPPPPRRVLHAPRNLEAGVAHQSPAGPRADAPAPRALDRFRDPARSRTASPPPSCPRSVVSRWARRRRSLALAATSSRRAGHEPAGPSGSASAPDVRRTPSTPRRSRPCPTTHAVLRRAGRLARTGRRRRLAPGDTSYGKRIAAGLAAGLAAGAIEVAPAARMGHRHLRSPGRPGRGRAQLVVARSWFLHRIRRRTPPCSSGWRRPVPSSASSPSIRAPSPRPSPP